MLWLAVARQDLAKRCDLFCYHFPCTAYGWVTNVTSDLTSAEMQPDITMATEGDTITLTVFYTKNSPLGTLRVTFFLDIGGTATGMYVYGVYTML